MLRPAGPVRSVVVFGHGWKLAPPSAQRPWVGQFRPWLDHLLARGNAVIFPRYQLGLGDDSGPARITAYRNGVAEGFRRLGAAATGTPVIVVGYSFGASLGFHYAGDAARWHLPVPRAVDCVFPAGAIGGAPLPALPRRTAVLIQVGDHDVEAGTGGGRALWGTLGAHGRPGARFVLVRSRPGLEAVHAAPKASTAVARAVFWTPLDQLVARARTGR